MLNGRKRYAIGIASLALAAGLIPSTPAQAEPDLGDVKARVERLYHEAEVASEHLHDAQLELTTLRRDLRLLEADQQRQAARVETLRAQVASGLVDRYQGHELSALGSVLTSQSSGQFLDGLTTMAAYDDSQAQVVDTYEAALKALQLRQDATRTKTAEIAKLTAGLADAKEQVDDRLSEAKGLLSRLQERQREAMLSRSSTVRYTDVPVSGRAAAAVNYAMAQVGDAYVYGAAGPSAFDCSGLTMMAWAQAGVALPHSSSAQYSSGPHVAASALQPGDLVFYYSPISHVGMYIGNGMIVHAANPSAGVEVSPLYSMPYAGAVRPG